MNDTEWTIATYASHNEAMRKVQNEFENERDRRYTEVNIEKEKVNRNHIYLGNFKNRFAAIEARKAAELKYWGIS